MAKRRSARGLSQWRASSASFLSGAAWLGLGALVFQRLALQGHYASAPASTSLGRLGVSILKPLCGVEPGLAESLESFAGIDYAPFELLLGVEHTQDPAYRLAQGLAARWPHVKVIVRGPTQSLNPKVGQLEALERYAQHPILLISDANMRPAPGYLDELSALFSNPDVGLVTNPYVGSGGSLGARLDGLQNVSNAANQLGAKRLAGASFALGGSEAVRRSTLSRLGGFSRYRGVLAEDYLMGRDVESLGERVAIGRLPVFSCAPARTVGSFSDRVSRWSTMQATAMGDSSAGLALGLLNPIPLAGLACLLAPGPTSAKVLGAIMLGKIAIDTSHARALGAQTDPLLIPLKDVVQFGAWAKGLVGRQVSWRGKKFNVGDGTRLKRAR